MKKNYYPLCGIFCLTLLLFSCKTAKKPVYPAWQTMNKQERLTSVMQSAVSFNSLSSNVLLTVSGTQKMSGTTVDAQLRIQHNKALQLSMRVPLLGIEAFRLLLTPDEVLVIDRLNKQYVSATMSELQGRMPFVFDYAMAEALWTNQLFVAGKSGVEKSDFSLFALQENELSANLYYSDRKGIRYNFLCNQLQRIQSVNIGVPSSDEGLQCDYSSWEKTSDQQLFPTKMLWKVQTQESDYQLDVQFKSVQINTSFVIDKEIPAKYKQVGLNQVIQLISKMI
ncbi:MAG: DUF4292 domain-containing protein [Candidatus Symbiothrix sp.]|jgi:hypothetical protein|nr:DUF4292 domain-containing protein [Candidatus Symbiothrix sp.]